MLQQSIEHKYFDVNCWGFLRNLRKVSSFCQFASFVGYSVSNLEVKKKWIHFAVTSQNVGQVKRCEYFTDAVCRYRYDDVSMPFFFQMKCELMVFNLFIQLSRPHLLERAGVGG